MSRLGQALGAGSRSGSRRWRGSARAQRVEHHHLVDAVDELGPEVLADDLHHRAFMAS
jgi:hypothetical protein